jgi:hypothetical protein
VLFTAGAKIGHFLVIGLAVLLVFQKIQAVQYRAAPRHVPQSGRRIRRGRHADPPVTGRHRIRARVRVYWGRAKLFLPHAYSDFLFSTIGSMGFIDSAGCLLFGLFISRLPDCPHGPDPRPVPGGHHGVIG